MQPVKLLNVLLIILLTMSVASCGIVPLWVSVTHTIGDVILTKETGKSSYEHVASTITGKDCKFIRILKDKKILITGATGGIGYSLVKKFNELDANILASGTNELKLSNLSKGSGT